MTALAAEKGAALVEVARALGPHIRAEASRTERDRRLPEALVEMMVAAGLFKLLVPASLGGSELDPQTYLRTVEEIARAYGSAGTGVAVQRTVYDLEVGGVLVQPHLKIEDWRPR